MDTQPNARATVVAEKLIHSIAVANRPTPKWTEVEDLSWKQAGSAMKTHKDTDNFRRTKQ
jgi:hypothetical protein